MSKEPNDHEIIPVEKIIEDFFDSLEQIDGVHEDIAKTLRNLYREGKLNKEDIIATLKLKIK